MYNDCRLLLKRCCGNILYRVSLACCVPFFLQSREAVGKAPRYIDHATTFEPRALNSEVLAQLAAPRIAWHVLGQSTSVSATDALALAI